MRWSESVFIKCAFILLGLFSLGLLVSVFHHHEDGLSHETCLLCVLIAHQTDMAIQHEDPVFLPNAHLLFSSNIDSTFLSTSHQTFLIRAPPA